MKRALLCLLLPLAALLPAPAVTGDGAMWNATSVGDIGYLPLEDLRSFYKLLPLQAESGTRAVGNGAVSLVFGPGSRELRINGIRCVLTHPVKDVVTNQDLLISKADMVKLIDPVLRPTYIANRRLVKTIVIDPGHGGHDSGAVSAYAREKDCNLAVALKLREKLQKKGYKVVMTRDSDFFLTLQQRVQIANKVPDCVFVSIHHNSGGSAATGIETFTLAPHGTTSPFARTRRTEDLAGNNQDSENIALATAVHSRAILATRAFDRGIQRARFSVLCTIQRPAILFEGGFVSNATEGRKIATEEYQNMLAETICQGIMSYAATVCNNRPAAAPAKGKGNVRSRISGAEMERLMKKGGRK